MTQSTPNQQVAGGNTSRLPYTETHTTVENVWLCSIDGLNYVSPRCGLGGTHREVTVTKTVVTTVTSGWGK